MYWLIDVFVVLIQGRGIDCGLLFCGVVSRWIRDDLMMVYPTMSPIDYRIIVLLRYNISRRRTVPHFTLWLVCEWSNDIFWDSESFHWFLCCISFDDLVLPLRVCLHGPSPNISPPLPWLILVDSVFLSHCSIVPSLSLSLCSLLHLSTSIMIAPWLFRSPSIVVLAYLQPAIVHHARSSQRRALHSEGRDRGRRGTEIRWDPCFLVNLIALNHHKSRCSIIEYWRGVEHNQREGRDTPGIVCLLELPTWTSGMM